MASKANVPYSVSMAFNRILAVSLYRMRHSMNGYTYGDYTVFYDDMCAAFNPDLGCMKYYADFCEALRFGTGDTDEAFRALDGYLRSEEEFIKAYLKDW